MELTTMHGVDAWHIRSDSADAWVSVNGAMVAPVKFHQEGRTAQPYSLAPWEPGTVPGVDPLLDGLRGDFFCLPFGPQPDGPQHGQTASAAWTAEAATPSSVTLRMEASDIDASVTRTISLRDGETVLYQEVLISGLDGDLPYGTHPILDFSPGTSGPARISTSRMAWSSTNPLPFADPGIGETQVLAVDALFDTLDAIPRADGSTLDVSRYPTTPGHEDLVMLVNDPGAGNIGWSAASFEGFTWFALKDVRSFPATLLWISNGGRSQAPWSSRHTARMGIEDVCSHFADGLNASRRNPLRDRGIPTVRTFDADTPVRLGVAQGVVFTPTGFGRVLDIDTSIPGLAVLTDDAGTSVETRVDWSFVLEM